MTSITNSKIAEDRYIANLAGMKGGKKALEGFNKFRGSTQESPLGRGIATAILGAFAYPLINSDMRWSFLGPAQEICYAAGSRATQIGFLATNLLFRVRQQINPEATFNNIKTGVAEGLASFGLGLEAANTCLAANDKTRMGYRAVNYLGSVGDTFSGNYMVIGASAVSLAVVFALTNIIKARYDRQAEKDTKNALTDRVAKIAARLTALEDSDEVKECAKNILERCVVINQEIVNLKLPNLTWNKIVKITQPLFDAAQKKLNERKIEKITLSDAAQKKLNEIK